MCCGSNSHFHWRPLLILKSLLKQMFLYDLEKKRIILDIYFNISIYLNFFIKFLICPTQSLSFSKSCSFYINQYQISNVLGLHKYKKPQLKWILIVFKHCMENRIMQIFLWITCWFTLECLHICIGVDMNVKVAV